MIIDIEAILEELQLYKRTKSELIINYIKERLDNSFNTYYNEIVNSFHYVAKNDDLKILKNIK